MIPCNDRTEKGGKEGREGEREKSYRKGRDIHVPEKEKEEVEGKTGINVCIGEREGRKDGWKRGRVKEGGRIGGYF